MRIFEPLGMRGVGFQTEEHPDEATPYTSDGQRGVQEQQNWHCGNAFVVCTLRDAHLFLQTYKDLLAPVCFFCREGGIEILFHTGIPPPTPLMNPPSPLPRMSFA